MSDLTILRLKYPKCIPIIDIIDNAPHTIPVETPVGTYDFWVRVSVPIAEQLLVFNLNNRPIKKNALQKYVSDMRSGFWSARNHNNGLGFLDIGTLGDGQNRLTAMGLVSKDKPNYEIWFRTTFGLTLSDQRDMDSGVVRTAADNIRLVYGTKNVAPACRLLHMIDAGGIYNLSSSSNLSSAQTENTFLEWRDHLEAARQLMFEAPNGVFDFKSVCYAAIAMIHRWEKPSNLELFIQTLKNTTLAKSEHDPAYRLHNFLIGTKYKKTDNAQHANQVTALSVFIKAWLKWKAGENVKVPIHLIRGERILWPENPRWHQT